MWRPRRTARRCCSFPASRSIPRTSSPTRASRSCSTSAARAIRSQARGGAPPPLLLLSRPAAQTKNTLAPPRVSLMLDERRAGDPLEGARVMLMGTAHRTDDANARRRYLERQPEAQMFPDFGDFGFYRIDLRGAHLVAGFGRIVDLSRAELLTDLAGAEGLVSAEQEIVAHMNAEHLAAVRLYATRLLGDGDGDWRCVGCDPEGLELQWDRRARRLDFPKRVASPGVLRQVLKNLAEEARRKG